jgi:hypothetical protein
VFMRKRRTIAGIAIVLVCAAGALWLLAGKKRSFAFLEGHPPLVVPSGVQQELDRQYGGRCSIYTFEVEPAGVHQIYNELDQLGFVEGEGYGEYRVYARGEKTDLEGFKNGRSWLRYADLEGVFVIEDGRQINSRDPRYMLFTIREPGWVTVMVRERGERGPFDHLRTWLGL